MNSTIERKTMTQSNQVMSHLETGRSLTSIEAIGLYGITRLAAVVYSLHKQGRTIKVNMKTGVRGKAYASYSL
tara:strand:- start:247 stop:465 length:219 start_codon:yes stop_codon:yes gene_type:complete